MNSVRPAAERQPRPHPWEASYPDGVRWDAPVACMTLPDMLAQAAAEFQDKPAIVFNDRDISFRQLADAVDRMAAAIAGDADRPGTAMALYLPNTPYYPLMFFAGLKAGRVIVNLSPLDAKQTLIHKVSDSEAQLLVTTADPAMLKPALELLDAGLIRRVVVCTGDWPGEEEGTVPSRAGLSTANQLLAGNGRALDLPAVAVDDLALLQYTGGTTGTPRAAMLTHRNISSAVSMYSFWFGGQKWARRGEERVICVTPLFHIYALTTTLLKSIRDGATILMRPRFDAGLVLHDIHVRRATWFAGVPTMWIAIASHPDFDACDFTSLRYAGSSAAPLPLEVRDRIVRATGIELRGGWGMTETSAPGANIPRHLEGHAGTVGLPMPGAEIAIVDVNDPTRRLPFGQAGEICVRGPNVTSGYWKRPEETAKAFLNDFLLTGDIGYMDEGGFLFITDRKKDLIISGGFNVYPQMIEQAIYQHPSVLEVMVIGVADGYRGEAAKAFVQLRPGWEAFSLEHLRDFLSDKLGRHEMPAYLEFRQSLPRTAVGKPSKVTLREEEAAHALKGQAAAKKMDKTEGKPV